MKFTVVLVRPKNPENIGLVARNMKNTGFAKLRLVGDKNIDQKSYVTAVHARDILEGGNVSISCLYKDRTSIWK